MFQISTAGLVAKRFMCMMWAHGQYQPHIKLYKEWLHVLYVVDNKGTRDARVHLYIYIDIYSSTVSI